MYAITVQFTLRDTFGEPVMILNMDNVAVIKPFQCRYLSAVGGRPHAGCLVTIVAAVKNMICDRREFTCDFHFRGTWL